MSGTTRTDYRGATIRARCRASATALARPTLRAYSARARTDHFVTPAVRAGHIHEHIAKRFLHALRVRLAVAVQVRRAVVRRVIRDHVEHFLFRGAREVGNRTV